MKRTLLLLVSILSGLTYGYAQKTRTITAGYISSNTTWFNDTIYTLDGYVYVNNNATLTIQPGTIVKGGDPSKKSTLIITRNGKIDARGTPNMPVVFTSSKASGSRAPGDWGGIVILGKAVINRPTDCSTCPGSSVAGSESGIQNAIEGDLDNSAGDGLYGGTDNNHNSGTLNYVRIEFGGVVITPGNEINGLTMGGIGKGTNIHHIQVTQANDDGFEWFGGNADAKYLVSHRNIDDDFDTDFGFTGKVQFGIVQRDSNWYDIGSGPTTNGFESDNDGTGTEATPYTEPVFSNFTIVGPLANGTPLSFSSSFQNGLRIRRNSGLSLFNSIVMGWNDAVFVDGARSQSKLAGDTLLFKNNILAGNLRAINNSSGSAARSKVLSQNDSMQSANGILVSPFQYFNPDFSMAQGSAASAGAAFLGAKISDPFFNQTSFRGAIHPDKDSNWTNCWTEWDPQSNPYNNAPLNKPGSVADFSNVITSGRTVVFTNKSTNALSYRWDFGVNNSGNDTSVVSDPNFIFPANGSYTVTLITRHPCGNSVLSKTILIDDQTPNPVANFSFLQDSSFASLKFNFSNTTDEKGYQTTYLWNFGVNGSTTDTSTIKNPVFTFPASGTYTVKLVAYGQFGTDSVTKTFDAFPTAIEEKEPVISQVLVYPNPASSEIKVDFTMNRSSSVSVRVYDLLGHLVNETVVNEQVAAGNYTLPVSTEMLSSGLYLLRIESEAYARTVRIAVNK